MLVAVRHEFSDGPCVPSFEFPTRCQPMRETGVGPMLECSRLRHAQACMSVVMCAGFGETSLHHGPAPYCASPSPCLGSSGTGRAGGRQAGRACHSVADRYARASGAVLRRGSLLRYAMAPHALALDCLQRSCALTTGTKRARHDVATLTSGPEVLVPIRFAGCIWIESNLRAIRR